MKVYRDSSIERKRDASVLLVKESKQVHFMFTLKPTHFFSNDSAKFFFKAKCLCMVCSVFKHLI